MNIANNPRCTLALAIALVLASAASPLPAGEAPSAKPPEPEPIPGTGTVAGTITYAADAKRPWRLARYYVKGGKSGELAEAVVALSRPGLGKLAPPHTPTTAEIDQKYFQFTPETTAIQVGDSVKFLNSDEQLHNVKTSHLQTGFNVNMNPGGEHVEAFTFPSGIRRPYEIGCAFHSAMRAWIYVFDHPYFQVTSADGRFRLVNVPPGEYSCELAHPAGDLRATHTVTVRAGQTTTVDFHLSPDHKIGQGH